MSCFILITDGIDGLIGPIRVAYALGTALIKSGQEVSIMAPYISHEALIPLKHAGFDIRDLGERPLLKGQSGHLWLWFRNSVIKAHYDTDDCITINFSFELPIASTIFYAQGYVSDLLRDVASTAPTHYRIAYSLLKSIINKVDNAYHKALINSKIVIANSRFTAEMAKLKGVHVDDVINPPIDTNSFKPVNMPSNDYVLTYVGKETRFNVIKALADNGVKIRAFGSKTPWMPRWFLKHRNIDYLGKVSDEELVRLYANAKFTVFSFTHEPFGYVPVESMACGTPVLTYNRQGPGETVVNNETGWLVNNDEELVRLAIKLWVEGYPEEMRIKARARAMKYDYGRIMRRWMLIINRVSDANYQ